MIRSYDASESGRSRAPNVPGEEGPTRQPPQGPDPVSIFMSWAGGAAAVIFIARARGTTTRRVSEAILRRRSLAAKVAAIQMTIVGAVGLVGEGF
jgi:hypothetical protein